MARIVPRLMLERVEHQPREAGGRSILLLHDGEGRPDHLDDITQVLDHWHLVIPRAPRWAGSRGPGIYNWFTSPTSGVLDPVGFSDSLIQLELLVQKVTVAKAGAPKIGAIGFGQGATVLATLASLWPEWFSWLALVGGFWAELPEEMLPLRDLAGLPVLLATDGDGCSVDGSALTTRGAVICRADMTEHALRLRINAWAQSFERVREALI